MTFPTCASCEHFRQDFGTKRGFCFGVMPRIKPDGTSDDDRPIIKMNRPACYAHRPLPEGVSTLQHGKSDYETPGDAVKLARTEAQTRTEHQMSPPQPADRKYVGPATGNGKHEPERKGRR